MSAPLRFLGLAVLTYVGLRTASSALALEPIQSLSQQPAAVPSAQAAAAPMLPPGMPADMGPPPGAYGPAPYGPGLYGHAMAAGAHPPQAYAMPYPMMSAMIPAPRQAQPFYYPAPYPMPLPPSAATAAAASGAGASEGAISGYEGESAPIDQWPAIGTAGPYSLGDVQRTPSWRKDAPDNGGLAAARPRRWSVNAWALLRPPARAPMRSTIPEAG